MRKAVLLTYFSCVFLFSCIWCQVSAQNIDRGQFPDILNLSTSPSPQAKINVEMFSDMGAWHAYCLPGVNDNVGGFVGPVVMGMEGRFISACASKLSLKSDGKAINLMYFKSKHAYLPGMLTLSYENNRLRIIRQLIFINRRQAMIHTRIVNLGKESQQLEVALKGSFYDVGIVTGSKNNVMLQLNDDKGKYAIQFADKAAIEVEGRSYTADFGIKKIAPNKELSFTQIETYTVSNQDYLVFSPKSPKSVTKEFKANNNRWNGYLKAYFSQASNLSADQQKLAVKAIITLMTNWRSAAGDLLHDGVFPSSSYGGFYGFWSWDSWKQAVGLSLFNPELAKSNILCMFDYMDSLGMVADCIYLDKRENNWRDTKPPLSAWAVERVYQKSNDVEFVAKMYPYLVEYHRWWYAHRDHDRNGLCEYGSTDGSRIAAGWESGMDNAVRFDSAAIVKNGPISYSFNQESVDLNAYLYAEKKHLATIADILGKKEESERWHKEAADLLTLIRDAFYDSGSGYFYDRYIKDRRRIEVAGPEGWIPLYAGVASPEQAESVLRKMMDPTCFNTAIPLPTIVVNNRAFNPQNGYWRGPVWLDQFYFGIEGLKRYGYYKEAEMFKAKLLENAVGLYNDSPLFENYHPLTGQGLNARNFSWSAAHILMLLANQ